jgi:hypothetical protein
MATPSLSTSAEAATDGSRDTRAVERTGERSWSQLRPCSGALSALRSCAPDCGGFYDVSMINIGAINAQLVDQDSALRDRLAEISRNPSISADTKVVLDLLAEGIAAVHERQGNMITLMLQTQT